jgi:ElaB/YqjD/DUF883 family membrane-anchored ribosome-binding protein
MTTSTKQPLHATALSSQSLASNALHAGESALDATRQLATQVFEKAGEKLHDARFGARDLASRGLHSVNDKAALAQRQIGRYADATGRYVAAQPVKSALIAAAVGALIAGVLIAARRRNRQDY